MSLFLPPNVQPLPPSANLETWSDQDVDGALANAEFFKKPKGMENRTVELDYIQM
jgi:hypothetical protein